jgi:hypothetical protein
VAGSWFRRGFAVSESRQGDIDLPGRVRGHIV